VNALANASAPGITAVVASVQRREMRTCARLISRIEAADAAVEPVLDALYTASKDVPVIGITGPPGVGKSTLVDEIIALLRRERKSLAVLAIDPSSPFTGGAILGDRVRMARHNTDSSVFIRSMSTRGCVGGLSHAAGDALIVMGAMGFDSILVETVGVGQDEIDIMRFAHSIVVLQPPAAGDAIQTLKAGCLEIADIFAVTKSDLAGADEMANLLREAAELRASGDWRPPILKVKATTGGGVSELLAALCRHGEFLAQHPTESIDRRRRRARVRLTELVGKALHRRYGNVGEGGDVFERAVDDLVARRSAPHAAAAALIDAIGKTT